MANATLNDLVNALFRPDDEFYRENFRSFMTNPITDLKGSVSFTLGHFVKERASHGTDPYDTRFLDHFDRGELERVFGQDMYGKLILVKQLFEDRRLRDMSHHSQYLPYFVELLPIILKKGQSKEDILRWDTIVKDMIVEYAKLEHPYDYITGPLRKLVENSQSIEMLKKAKELVSRVKEEIPSKLYIFASVLGLVLGKVTEPQRLEEWYKPIIDVINKYENIGRRGDFDKLEEFIRAHNNPASLQSFRPYKF